MNAAKPEMFYLDEEVRKVSESGVLQYRSPRTPIWCPGCGYFGIQTALTAAIVELGIRTHELAIVSGIGCTGRAVYFMKAYSAHVLHGRALPVATGIRIARPDLKVLVLMGDGDGLGIGAGHFPHAARRNVDLVCLLYDNGLYSLTKGQTSPTTPSVQVTASHPYGNPDVPLKPVRFALAAGASFVARAYAGNPTHMQDMIRQAFLHKGFSFIHVVSPCVTFDSVNFTYPNLQNRLRPLPEKHDVRDLYGAIDRSLDPELFLGLFYKEDRPSFGDQMRAYADRAKEKQKGG